MRVYQINVIPATTEIMTSTREETTDFMAELVLVLAEAGADVIGAT